MTTHDASRSDRAVHEEAARAALAEIVRTVPDPTRLTSPERVGERSTGARREIGLLSAAAETWRDGDVHRAAATLAAQTGFEDAAARWAVGAWADAIEARRTLDAGGAIPPAERTAGAGLPVDSLRTNLAPDEPASVAGASGPGSGHAAAVAGDGSGLGSGPVSGLGSGGRPGGPGYRWRQIAGVVSAVVVVGVVALAFWPGGGDPIDADEDPVVETPAVDTQTPDPGLVQADEDLALLVSMVPPGIRPSCEELDDGPDFPGEVAELRCRLTGATAYYALYSTSAQARAAWAGVTGAASAERGPAEGLWCETDGPYTHDDEEVGVVRCFTRASSGFPEIQWVHESLGVFSRLIGDDTGPVAPLLDLWVSTGPFIP